MTGPTKSVFDNAKSDMIQLAEERNRYAEELLESLKKYSNLQDRHQRALEEIARRLRAELDALKELQKCSCACNSCMVASQILSK